MSDPRGFLQVYVYDFDTITADDIQGQVMIPISSLTLGVPLIKWYDLKPKLELPGIWDRIFSSKINTELSQFQDLGQIKLELLWDYKMCEDDYDEAEQKYVP